MLRYQSRSGEALWRRNTAATSTAGTCTGSVQTKYATTTASAANSAAEADSNSKNKNNSDTDPGDSEDSTPRHPDTKRPTA